MSILKQVFNKISAEGWKSLFYAIFRKVTTIINECYRNLILRNKLVVYLFPFKKPPVLLLSYPRSGSSWVGAILSKSKDVAYMFEPVTRPYQKFQTGYAMADLSDPTIFQQYMKYCREAFQGMPPKQLDSSEDIRDFSLLRREQRQLLIKEVNPRATRLFCQYYSPKILFLIRHPAAIALSFWQRGWLESPDVQLDTDNLHGSPWEKFGYAYGRLMSDALDVIVSSAVEYKIILYDDLAKDPLFEFKEVFDYLEVEIPDNYEKIIDEYCFSGTATQGYQTRRVSKKMISKWKKELSPDLVSDVKRGYLLSGLNFYHSSSDW